MPQVIVKPTLSSAPKSAADYQSDAMAALTASEKGTQKQTTTPPAEPGAVKAKGTDDGGATDLDPKVEASAENKEGEKKADEPEFLKGAFDKLTTEKAALRKDREALNTERKALEERAKAGEKFANAKTPMELLRAAGFTWKDAAEEMTGLRPEGDDEKPAKEEPKKLKLEDIDPDAARDLAEWRRERQERATKDGREKISQTMKDFAEKAGEKFKLVTKLDAYDKALEFIETHFAKHKELPGSTPAESMEIALASVEADLRTQAEKWKKALTSDEEGATQDDADEGVRESAVRATSDRAVSNTTLTNHSGGRTTTTQKKPSTPEEYRAAALAEMVKLEKR